MDAYVVTDGLTADDYIAFPDESLKAGMTCVTYDESTFDPSAGGGDMGDMGDTGDMGDMSGVDDGGAAALPAVDDGAVAEG